MPYKPLVSKIRVHNPNKKGSANANRNYVKYIATREGVSLETVNDINDVLNKDGMMEKVLREDVIHTGANNKEYLEYMARRPRSHGLFGNIDTEDLTEVSSRIDGLTKEGKVIYRGIISLGERDGEELGFRNAGAWNNYLKRVMPEIAQKLGISSYDHTWVAAFHAEESHPHVHYMLWDNQDRVKSPFIHKATQQSIRICLEEEMFDDAYERSVKLVYDEELKELNSIRNESRKQILNETENVMRETFAPGVEYEKIPQRVANEYLESIAQEAQELTLMLHGKGSMKYQYLPEDAKEQVQKIVDLVLQKPDIRDSMEKYMGGVKKTQQLKGWTRTRIQAVLEKEQRDIRKRIANKVLKEIRPVVLANEPQEEAERLREEMYIDTYLDRNLDESSIVNFEIKENFKIDSTEEFQGELKDVFQVNQTKGSQLEKEKEVCAEVVTDIENKEKFQYFIEWNIPYKMGMQLLYGEDGNFDKAFQVLEKEAIKGNVLAVFELGKIIDRELIEGFTKDEAVEFYDEARKAYEQIYENTDDNYKRQYSAYRMGKFFALALGSIEEPDYEIGRKWLEKAPDNRYAQYTLGKLYIDEKVYVSDKKDPAENREIGRRLFETSAAGNKGNPYAAYELGKIYERGVGVESNQIKSSEYYSKALRKFIEMSNDSTDDMLFYRIGKMYMDGLGTETDTEKGERYILKASKLGNKIATIQLASIYMGKEDASLKEKAVKLLEDLAKLDEPLAQYKLGAIYANEENKEAGYYNLEKAVSYLEKAEEQGNEFAQYKLGAIYANRENEEAGYYNLEKAVSYLEKAEEKGNEFVQYKLGTIYADKGNEEIGYYDLKKAVTYLEKSAEQGNQYAQYKLGAIYANKENEEAGYYNLEKAVSYLEKAEEKGNEFVQYKLGTIYADKGNEEIGYYDLKKAVTYLEKSAEQGNQYAQYKLGAIYANKENEEAGYYNLEKAVSYLEKAEKQNNEYAQYKLGVIYSDQNNTGQGYYNIEKSMEYLKKAAVQNNEYAQYRLGMIYLDKSFGRYDLREALRYLNLSAEQSNQFAQCRLGCMYYFGKEVSQDKELGAYWLQRSADQGNQFAQDILNGGCIGINFSYCLLKGVLMSLESMNRQTDYTNYENMRTQSRQAARERHLHRDHESPGE